jgi:tetratricopeptide (TPR) repeat protein
MEINNKIYEDTKINEKEDSLNLKEIGDKYFNENNYEEAINNYTLQLDNSSADNKLNNDNKFKIYMNRCLAYYKLSKFELGLEDAIKATKINTNSGKAWSRVGSCLLSLKKYYSSLSAFEKATELEPENELYKNLYENAYDTIKANKILEETKDEDTEDEDDNKSTKKDSNKETTSADILNLTNKLKNLKNTEGLADLLKDNDLNMPTNFVNGIFSSILNNKTLIDKLSKKEFQNKVIGYQKNPLGVFNDKEMMDLMNDVINKTKFDQ